MAYIGTAPTDGQYTILDDIASSFNGSTTTFNLSSGGVAVVPQTDANALISISGVVQYTSAYSISSSQITLFGKFLSLGKLYFLTLTLIVNILPISRLSNLTWFVLSVNS